MKDPQLWRWPNFVSTPLDIFTNDRLNCQMGYDAYVRCRCWEDGQIKPGPFPLDQLEIDDYDDMPATPIVPGGHDMEILIAFDSWVRSCCEHENMHLVSASIGNIASMGHLRYGFEAAGPPCTTLRSVLPETNEGRVESEISALCLKELATFEASSVYSADPSGFDFMCAALRKLFEASVQTGRPVIWT
jgi:hypothetical protein